MLTSSRVVRVVVAAALTAAFLLVTPQVASAGNHEDPGPKLGDICGASEGKEYDDDGNAEVVTTLMRYQMVDVRPHDSDNSLLTETILACAATDTGLRPSSTLQDNLGLRPSGNEVFWRYQKRCEEKFFHNRYEFALDDTMDPLSELLPALNNCVALHYR